MTESDRELIRHLSSGVHELQTSMLELHNLLAEHKADTRVENGKVAARLEALIQAHASFVNATEERVDDHSSRMDKNALEANARIAKIERSAAWVRAWSAGAAAALVAVFGALVWVGARLPALAQAIGGK